MDPIKTTPQNILTQCDSYKVSHKTPWPEPAPKVKKTQIRPLRSYIVHIEKKYPAWNEVGGFDVEVSAYDANDAVKTARKQMSNDCFFGSQDGPVSYRARLKKD